MAKEPLTISWDELNTRKVDQRLREQQALTRNRAYARLDADQLPVATPRRQSLRNSTTFWMAAMGLLGGLLAWTCGFLPQIQPAEQQAIELYDGIQRVEVQRGAHIIPDDQAKASIAAQRLMGESNPYFEAIADEDLTPTARDQKLAETRHRAAMKHAVLNTVSFGLCGMLLAMCLGLAEPLSERNLPRAVRNGALGATLGLIGGIAVSLFVDRIYRAAGGGGGAADPQQQFTLREALARSAAWGVLGLFLAAGPGLLLGNVKKVLIGLAGGLIGGTIGGALYQPVTSAAGPDAARLVALGAIGLIAGLGTGLIENVAKTGWLKVTTGLIAGKQFILYRNPTYIGSGPECQIYLFRDPNIGRRHAALHLVPGGIELEDLPLGKATLVNDAPVTRTRLHHGDKISIGATTFLFQEKVKKK
ncbi:MAG TPA: FHA domain-containing protein [Tepidisphaeraceae bacterium]|jgi:hypothetical protein